MLVAFMLACGAFFGMFSCGHTDDEVSTGDLTVNQPCVVIPSEIPLVTWELRQPKVKDGFELSPGILSKWKYRSGHDDTAPPYTDIREAMTTAEQWIDGHFDVSGIDIKCTKATVRQGRCLLEFTQYYKCLPTNLVSSVTISGKEVVRSSMRLATVTVVGKDRRVMSAADAEKSIEVFFRQDPKYPDYKVLPGRLVLRYDYCLQEHDGVDRSTALVPVYMDVDNSFIVVDAFFGKCYLND